MMLFKGTGTALVTPFAEGGVDFDAYGRLIEDQIRNGVNALVVLGTTGEAATMTLEEREAVIRFAAKTIAGRVPMIVGSGTNCTATTIETSRRVVELGADAVLVVTPFYNKPTQEGLYQHFKAVAQAVDVPVILYNVPGRTGCNLAAETTIRLSRIDNIVAVKEASGNQYQCDTILRAVRESRPDFAVYSGNDDQAFHLVCSGGAGVISVLSNAAPAKMVAMINAALEGDLARAAQLHLDLLPLMKDLFVESNPIPVKYATELLGFGSAQPRLPLVAASQATREIIRRDLVELGLIASEA